MTQTRVIKFFSLLVFLIIFGGILQRIQGVYSFHFNWLALLSGFTAAVNLILLGVLNKPKLKNRATIWFSLYIFLLTIWCLSEMMTRLGADYQTAEFWFNLGAIGWVLMPAAFIVFVKVYSDAEAEIEQASFWASILAVPFIILVLHSFTDLVSIHNPATTKLQPWGYDLAPGPLFTIFLVWLEFMFISGLYILFRIYRRSRNAVQKKQVKVFLIATLVPLVGGTFTDGLFPILGIEIFPTATILISFMSLMIVYGIRRYGLFQISPTTYSGTILETMGEAVLGLDSQFNIRYANQGAQRLLGLGLQEITSSSLASILTNTVFRDIANRMKSEVEEGETVQIGETQVVHPGKGLVWVSLSSTKVKGSDGSAAGYVLVMANITQEKRLLANLETERDRIGAIINSITEGLITVDPDMYVLTINPAAENMLGLVAKDCIGRKYYELFTELRGTEVIDRDELLLQRTLRKNQALSFTRSDDILLAADGHKFSIAGSTAPLYSNDQISGAMLVFRDITDEKHAAEIIEREVLEKAHKFRETQAKFEASIQSLQLGFIMTDKDGNILNVNQAAGSLLGPANLTEGLRKIEKLLAYDLTSEMVEVLRTQKPRGLKEVPFGSRFLRIFVTPIVMGGDSIGCVLLFEDVTQEKILQRSREEFFSIASHELRTPLSAIRGNTAMIQSYYSEQIKDKDFKNMIDDIHESSVRLIELVNDFLDASRLEQGKMTLEPVAFKLEEVVDEVTKEMQIVAKEKNVKVLVDMGSLPEVYSDRNKVKQVIYNLVGNALKFTDEGNVTVKAKTDGEHVRVEVSDTGKGIPIDKQMLLFHKFQQAGDSLLTRDNTRGTGLGLYISKLLVEKMGGEIGLASSVPGKGTTFYFTLPLADEKKVKKAPPKVASGSKIT